MAMTTERAEGVERLTLDFHPMNTLDIETVTALRDYFYAYDNAGPLVISGAGKAFCAGVNTAAFNRYGPQQQSQLFDLISQMTCALIAIDQPVIAAVNGHALGGGFVLALCCDYRIAVEGDHHFGIPEAKAGVPFPEGPGHIIRHEMSPALLRHLALTSRTMSARQLHQHFVFDELVAPAVLPDTAVKRALELQAQPGFEAVKKQIRGPLRSRLHKWAPAK